MNQEAGYETSEPFKKLTRRERAVEARGRHPTVGASLFIIFYTTAFCIIGMVVPLLLLDHLGPLEWLTIPISFLIANVVEYLVHRFPLHVPNLAPRSVLELHMIHHNYFNEQNYKLNSNVDFIFLIFPAGVLNALTIFITLPGAYLISTITNNSNIALLFIATVMGYYLLMQIIHVATHVDESHWCLRIPGIKYLWQHHNYHHQQEKMTSTNFNFIIPISDWLFRTSHRSPLELVEDDNLEIGQSSK